MVLSLLFGKKYPSPKVGSIDLDVTIREEHRFASRVTNYPIEDGTILSDHIINEPQRLVIDTSVRLQLDQGNVFGGVQNKIPRDIVASNANYPLIQNDPVNSLKDQASSGINVGVQSLI